MTRRSTVLAAVAVAASATLTASPADADTPARTDIRIVAETSFESASSPFTSTIASCESGTVSDADFLVVDAGPHGVFNGVKRFACDGGGTIDIRLVARFNAAGSTGSWAIVDGTGELAGLRGAGKLVGVPTGTGITDIYVGSVTG